MVKLANWNIWKTKSLKKWSKPGYFSKKPYVELLWLPII